MTAISMFLSLAGGVVLAFSTPPQTTRRLWCFRLGLLSIFISAALQMMSWEIYPLPPAIAVERQPAIETSSSLSPRVDSLSAKVETLSIGYGFFDGVITSITAIFSTIVVVLITIAAYFSYVRTQELVREQMREVNDDLDKWKKITEKAFLELVKHEIDCLDRRVEELKAEMYRTIATVTESTPMASHIWWLRAAGAFHSNGNGEFVSTSLSSALEMLKKLTQKEELQWMNEASTILTSLEPSGSYRIEIDALRNQMARIYGNSSK